MLIFVDGSVKYKLNAIIYELAAVSKEIENVASQMGNIKGVGADKCAIKLLRISDKYKYAKNQLYKVK